MFFYRDTVIRAKTRDDLFAHSECPICKNKLAHDWKMPFRYEPMVLFRMLLIGGAFATLLCLLLVKIEEKGWLAFLNRLSYSTQLKLVVAFLVCICLPAAFLVIWGEIKLGHWTRDNMIVYGLRCPTCGNGFAGLVSNDNSDVEMSCKEATEVTELSCAGQSQAMD